MSDLSLCREAQKKNILRFGEFLWLTDRQYLALGPNSAALTVRLGMAPSLFLIEDFME